MRTKSRYTAVVIAVLILILPFFIAHHADHDCTGDDCPVCAVIYSFERIMGGAGSVQTAVSLVFCAAVCPAVCIPVMSAVTPVMLKVRLLN
ncbi:MAG: hypothetical protein J6I96_00885 [Oscillospiraceae bacterium]|nr:hypothetical protein [Oscillospiraceae bacterium]